MSDWVEYEVRDYSGRILAIFPTREQAEAEIKRRTIPGVVAPTLWERTARGEFPAPG